MKVDLTTDEIRILERYRGHLWRIAKVVEPGGLRGVLRRVLGRCREELDMVEKNLKAEYVRALRR